jgi:hypothetical protein
MREMSRFSCDVHSLVNGECTTTLPIRDIGCFDTWS